MHFPPGIYLVTSVHLRPGIRYVGYGATIKRPPRQGKWVRTFVVQENGGYRGEIDSQPLVLEGLAFDGNRRQQGPYTAYELEQAHLVFLSAAPDSPGRLRVRIANCTFQDCVGDAVSIYCNVEAQISRCTAVDCFRGGITITGGNTRVQISDFIARGTTHPSGIDVEVDGPGYQGNMAIDLQMNNVFLPDGDFDVGVLAGSRVQASNVVAAAPLNIYGGGESTLQFDNCVFGVGGHSSTANRIVLPGDCTFSNCRFYIDGKSEDQPARWSCIHLYWAISGSPGRDQLLTFDSCRFEVGAGIAEKDEVHAFYIEASRTEENNALVIRDCRISAAYDQGIYLAQGGQVSVDDSEILAGTAFTLGSAENYPFDVRLRGIRVARESTYMHLVTHLAQNTLLHQDVLVDESANRINTTYGLQANQYLGGRTVLGSAPPNAATPGLVNDVYRLKSPRTGADFEWLCVQSGAGSGAKWKPVARLND